MRLEKRMPHHVFRSIATAAAVKWIKSSDEEIRAGRRPIRLKSYDAVEFVEAFPCVYTSQYALSRRQCELVQSEAHGIAWGLLLNPNRNASRDRVYREFLARVGRE